MPVPVHPPREWFDDPGFSRLTPLTVLDTGRVLGHLAGWDSCHTGFPGECVRPPRSPSGYAYFLLGEVECSDGSRVACGQITMHTGHAQLRDSAAAARAHYDHTGVAVADVAAGEDAYGPWLAGALRPSISAEDRRALSGAKLSGDWRSQGGALELLGILAVNVPGFVIPRARVASGEPSHVEALVAGGQPVVTPHVSDRLLRARLDALHLRATGGAAALYDRVSGLSDGS